MLGRYQIVREIARSNDIVWEARDPQMNRRLAVKELQLPAPLTGQARRDRIERFFREARAAGAMNHPNIVTIFEVGEDRGRFFIAMEYLEGQTLRERLTVGGALPLSEAVAISVALCDALDYAHLRGVIHRDIKPDNIHLLPGGRVKLTDFGIARITTEDQLTVAGQVFGTPSYMSPEQIEGRPIDARSDLFALGVLLFEMVAGQKPFKGDSVPTIINRIITTPTPHAPGASPAVDAVIQKATAKDPSLRFASASEFRSTLLAAAASRTGNQNAFAPASQSPSPEPAIPQLTAHYGARTQAAVAPGHSGGVSAPPVTTARSYDPAPYAYEAPPRDTAKIITAVAASVLLLATVSFGVIWAFSRAMKQSGVSAAAPASPTRLPGVNVGVNQGNPTVSSRGNETPVPLIGTRPPLQDILSGTPAEKLIPSPSPSPAGGDGTGAANAGGQTIVPVDNTSAQVQQAQALFQEGVTLYDQGRLVDAYYKFQHAQSTAPPGSKVAEDAGAKMRYLEMTRGQGDRMPDQQSR